MEETMNDSINNTVIDGWVTIGKYDLKNWGDGEIHISCNEKSNAQSEGGTFSEAELEKVIKEFYDRYF